MNKLLNRFAWGVSITLWSTLGWYLGWFFGFYRMENIFFVIILTFLIKKTLFSSSFIEDRLVYFAEILKEEYIRSRDNSWIISTEEKIKNFNSEENVEKIEEIKNIEKEDKNLEKIEEIKIVEKENKIFEKKEIKSVEKEDKNLEEIEEIKNVEKENRIFEKIVEKKLEPSKIDILIEKIKKYIIWNTVSFIWGVFLFFGVISLLKITGWAFWIWLWPFWQMILWFVIWFVVFLIWVFLDKKWNKNEAFILMWLSILINYAVILAWRYFIWDDLTWNNWYLSSLVAFVFLILNTIFAIVVSLFYTSKALLIFSFIFAYINPFIINWGPQTEPYMLLWYSFIISLWALFISYKSELIKSNKMLFFSFIFWNLLFLIADFSDSIWWSAKIIITAIFSIITILILRKKENYWDSVVKIFILTYIFIILNLWDSTIVLPWDTFNSINFKNILSEKLSFIVYFSIIIWLFVSNLKLIKSDFGINLLKIILFFPLLILLMILFSWNLLFAPFILGVTVIWYLAWFIFLQKILSNVFSYIIFWVLAVFIFLFNYNLNVEIILKKPENIDLISFISVLFTAFIFLFSSYYYSIKKNLVNLYAIWTIGSILILVWNIINKDSNMLFYISIIAIIIFTIANWIMPFVNNRLLKKQNFNSLIIWSLAGVWFIWFEIFNFQEWSFSEMMMWFMFVWLAILYFLQAFFITEKIWVKKMQKDEDLKNIFYTFAWISISLFSIAIAFIFSQYPEIITVTWLFEATILYYFYSKNSSDKLFAWATVLFLIWLTKFWILIDKVKSEDYMFLISFSIILASFILNLFFINKANKIKVFPNKNITWDIFHNILHLIWMWIMGLLLIKIIPSSGHWWSILWISVFLTILGSFYAKLNFKILKFIFIALITIFSIYHLEKVDNIFYKLNSDELNYLKIIQYIVSIIIISNIFIWKKINILNNKINFNKILLFILSIYTFLISNIYILDIFEKFLGNYSLTIYWGLIAVLLLLLGITKDIIKYRAIWLYFLVLTTLKVIYDIQDLWSSTAQILIYIILWGLLLLVSTLYTRKYWNNILLEMKFSSFIDEKENKEEEKKDFESSSEWQVIKNTKNNIDENINKEIDKNKEIDENINKEIDKNKEIDEGIKNDKVKDIQKKEKNNFFMEKLTKIDVSNIKVIRFFPNKSENFTIRAKNIMRLAVSIEWKMKKNNFKPWELLEVYNHVIKNYKTKLSRREYDKIRTSIKMFIDEWGRIEIVEK